MTKLAYRIIESLDEILAARSMQRWQKIDDLQEIARTATRMAEGLSRNLT